MSDGCRAFEHDGAAKDAAQRAAWADHARVCASCREQEAADRALRGLLAGAPPPQLPPSFAQRCAIRVRRAPPAAPLAAGQRLVLRAYWILTAVVAAAVSARIVWSLRAGSGGGPHVLDSLAGIPPVIAAGAVVALAAILTPVLLLAHLRGGLLALMRRMLGAAP